MSVTKKSQIQDLLAQLLENSSEEDEEVLLYLLTGLQDKSKGIYNRYINAVLHMEGEYNADEATVRIPITPVIHNNIKAPHGGILATIADTAMGDLASKSVPKGYNVVTTNLTISYLKTTTNKELVAHSRFVHKGSQMLVMECIVEDETGKKLATATGTFFVIQPRQ